MKNTVFSILAVLLLTALIPSCSHFDKLGKDPYAIYDAPSQEYVHPIMFKMEKTAMSVFKGTTSRMMQYACLNYDENTSKSIDNYSIVEGVVDDIWLAYYPLYGNAAKMYDQAVKEENKGLQGVALILKALLITQITDTYGDVPFSEAADLILAEESTKYTTAYDTQKDIYYAVVGMLEDANSLLAAETARSFNPVCDKTFNGNFDKWRRFGNTLYARVLMRIGMKVIEETDGIMTFKDGRKPISVTDKLADLYQCYLSGGGIYPLMQSRSDRPMIPFDKNNETEQSPFFSTTSGNWRNVAVCDVMVSRMLDGTLDYFEVTDPEDKEGKNKIRPCGDILHFYPNSLTNNSSHAPDPRFGCWWHRMHGMPPQMSPENVKTYTELFSDLDELGTLGVMVYEGHSDYVWTKRYGLDYSVDIKNPTSVALMQYSELLFIFAEAGARGWIAALEGEAAVGTMLRKAVIESILEWNDHVTTETSFDKTIPLGKEEAPVTDYVTWVMEQEHYSGKPFGQKNALEAVLTQKWIASFYMGIESWCDYRRTGYPLLKTNGPVAQNNKILPTRLRYPSDEAYRNVDAFSAAVSGWLGGSNNMQTDVWWADTEESKTTRLKGRQ